jgi:hypothetical protein
MVTLRMKKPLSVMAWPQDKAPAGQATFVEMAPFDTVQPAKPGGTAWVGGAKTAKSGATTVARKTLLLPNFRRAQE